MTKTSTAKDLADLSIRAGRSTIAVIDAMFQRGAIKGEEALTIGSLRQDMTRSVSLAETLLSELAQDDAKK